MQTGNEVIIINEFDEYYQLTNGVIRAKNPDFHIYRLSEIGKKVVSKMGPFKINYFHLSLGSESMEGFFAKLLKSSFNKNLEQGMQRWLDLLKNECEK